eukprot:TRINITY_DN2393_c0_g1_i1.p1 TRINITY_DN2393_c0_g1~~TRINITY_DN2393_c0_g1_i1.p1  ORF type:complete len:331 (+),score=54.21 TRINITY_DN2393_c0_g1_i1:63-1055(+)
MALLAPQVRLLPLLLLLCAVTRGEPVFPRRQIVAQPGAGSGEAALELVWHGDEWQQHWETVDGYSVYRDEQTLEWMYVGSGKGVYSTTEKPWAKSLMLPEWEKQATAFRSRAHAYNLSAQPVARDQETGPFSSTTHVSGTRNVLVIMVEFQDQDLLTSESAWSNYFYGTTGLTVNSYYLKNSNGKFSWKKPSEACGATASDGVARVSLNMKHPNYPVKQDETLVYNAVQATLAALGGCIDFNAFDTNSDGYITPQELVLVNVWSGTTAAFCGSSAQCPSMHSAMYTFSVPFSVGSKQLASAVILGELGDCTCTTPKLNNLGSIGRAPRYR